MELRPGWVSDGSRYKAGSAAEIGTEELRQRMDQQPEEMPVVIQIQEPESLSPGMKRSFGS